AYRLLAFVNLVRDERLDESLDLLKRAIGLSPRRREYALLLAQIYLRRDEFEDARRILGPLAGGVGGGSLAVRSQAERLIAATAAREEYLARVRELDKKNAEAAAREEAPLPGVRLQPCDAPQPGPQLKKLRFAGKQACGLLVRFECDDEGVLLVVESDGRTLHLRSDSPSNIRFVTYTTEVRGQVTCGERTPESPVLVTYRPARSPAAQSDGVVVAVEFVPREWNANH
ncbi:MAG TPA: tetratricopeptide repeat protein, partial [Pyrinomonadaceae bacterium]|nr:tetratricopeptide repeat protein [Pyrinomonadaceae bacterium]